VGHLRRAPSGNWRAAYRTPEGRERTRTFRTKREARAFLAQVEGDKTRGLYVDPAGAQLRFRELADRWWAAREVELTTAAANRSRLDKHVLPMWGEWPIGRIEHLDVQAWVTRLSRRLAPETVASCHGLLSAILATAVRSRKLGANPCDGVRLPPRRRTADAGVTITREQLLGQVLPAVPRRYRAMVATAAGAGLRWGECVGLRRRSIDLLRRELQVVEVAVEVAGRVTCKSYPKSKASRRRVPLPDFVIEALAEHLAAFPAELDELVFRNERGGPLLRANFRQRVWLPALARSGLIERPKFHDLRHCYATWLISDGVPVNVVQAVMGHEQASTTLNRYTHVPADTHARVRAALNAAAACSPPAAVRAAGDDR
jgi:integrase